ncbi:hypothetical protein N8477_06105 [Candidatus Thioglobus sp.]|nr:hypothetical protein [Candidatus Thioglobus sp.]
MSNNNFSFSAYAEIFSQYKSSIKVNEYKKHNKGIIVRHDIDWDIQKAYEFSEFEKSIGISSTYYVMITSNIYNVFSPINSFFLLKMIKNGFEIGLHFDPMLYTNRENSLSYYFHKEIEIFENFFQTKILSYSMHQPSIHGTYLKTNLIDAYSSEIFTDECYISDSCFNFRGKNPIEFLSKSTERLMQFLTHPSQWSESGINNYEEFVNYKIKNFKNEFYAVYEHNYEFQKQKKLIKINDLN